MGDPFYERWVFTPLGLKKLKDENIDYFSSYSSFA
jgi:hypothetical protein